MCHQAVGLFRCLRLELKMFDLNVETILVLGGALWVIGGVLSLIHTYTIADKIDSINNNKEQK